MKAIKKIVAGVLGLALMFPLMPTIKADAMTYSDFVLEYPNNLSRTVDVAGRFEIKEAGFYVIETDNAPNDYDCDSIMYLYDANQNFLGMNDDNTSNPEYGKCSTICRYLEKGSYYLRVKGKNYTEVLCTLRIDPLDKVEKLPLNSTKSVNYQKEDDWKYIYHKEYRIDLDSPKDVIIETSKFADIDKDTVLTLYDDCHNVIMRNDNKSAEDLYSKIETNLSAGTYYVKIDTQNLGLLNAVATISLTEK